MAKKKKLLWIKVSNDEYEHIVAMADTASELARMCNTTTNAVLSAISHAKSGRNRGRSQYRRVEIDDENEGEEATRNESLSDQRLHRR